MDGLIGPGGLLLANLFDQASTLTGKGHIPQSIPYQSLIIPFPFPDCPQFHAQVPAPYPHCPLQRHQLPEGGRLDNLHLSRDRVHCRHRLPEQPGDFVDIWLMAIGNSQKHNIHTIIRGRGKGRGGWVSCPGTLGKGEVIAIAATGLGPTWEGHVHLALQQFAGGDTRRQSNGVRRGVHLHCTCLHIIPPPSITFFLSPHQTTPKLLCHGKGKIAIRWGQFGSAKIQNSRAFWALHRHGMAKGFPCKANPQ